MSASAEAPERFGWESSGASPHLRDLGETELLGLLVGTAAEGARLEVGPGDDSAVWRVGEVSVAVTTDSLVEDVDFRRDWQSPYEVGLKAWGAAASDLAAMGFGADLGLACLVCRPETAVAAVVAIQAGLVAAARRDGATLAGGDVSSTSGPLTIAVSALGRGEPGSAVRLGGARPGDLVVVTGVLGEAAAALERLEAGGEVPEGWRRRLTAPAPRLMEGQELRRVGASALTDLSDGLLLDAGRIAAASRCRVELFADRLPLGAGLELLGGERALRLAVTGGEDFELLACLPPHRLPALTPRGEGSRISVVGQVVAGAGAVLLEHEAGAEVMLGGRGGFRHF